MKQTENLQLPILQSGDKYTKETQNEAFKKVDLHLGGLAKRVNNIIASGGESNIEIVDARVDNNTGVVYNTIGERINSVSEQIDTKANDLNEQIYTMKKETEAKNSKIVYKAISGTLNNSSIYIKDTDIAHLKNIGADLTLCVMCSVTSETDNNIEIMDNERVTNTIKRCNAQGVNVNMIKPHIGLNFEDTLNRKNYNPTGKNLFFKNWTNVLLNYANICNTYNIPLLCISVEMVELTKNTWADNWKKLYEDIKAKYPNVKLLHAPKNWEFADEGNELSLQYCDILGCTFYSHYTHKSFSKTDKIDIKELGKSFYYTDDNFRFMELVNTRCKKYNKEFYIMEIGCMALDDGLIDVVPDSYKSTTIRDNLNVQSALMKAFFKYCLPNENIIGFSWWHMRNPFEFYKDDKITIAEQTMKDYCKRGVVND